MRWVEIGGSYPPQASLFETEDKFRQALKRYGAKIEARLGSELPDNRREVQAHPEGDTDAEKAIRYIKQADPTPQGTYTEWLVTRWIAGSYNLEDLKPISDNLRIFNNKRAQMPEKDILRYRTPADLAAAVAPHRTVDNTVPVHFKGREAEMARPPHADILRNDGAWLILMPTSMEGAQFWGCHTGSKTVEPWCITWGIPGTAYKNHSNRFDSYTQGGRYPFVFVFDKRGVENFREGSAYAIRLLDDQPVLTLKENGPEIDALPYLAGDLAPAVSGRFAQILHARYPWMRPDFWESATAEQVEEAVAKNPRKMAPLAIQHGRLTKPILADIIDTLQSRGVEAIFTVLAEIAGGRDFLDEDLLLKFFERGGPLIAQALVRQAVRSNILLTPAVMTAACKKDGTIYRTLLNEGLNPPEEAMLAAASEMSARISEGRLRDLTAFLPLPPKLWPDQVVSFAIYNGRMEYEDMKRLAPDTQKRFLASFLYYLADKNPKDLAKIDRADWRTGNHVGNVIGRNPQSLQHIPLDIVTDDDIAHAARQGDIYGTLGYLPPKRITAALFERLRAIWGASPPHGIRFESPDQIQRDVRAHWVRLVARAPNFEDVMETLPAHYRTAEFLDEVVDQRGTRDTLWLVEFVYKAHKLGLPVTDKMIQGVLEPTLTPRDRVFGRALENARREALQAVVKTVGWGRVKDGVIIASLRNKALQPDDVPRDRITPKIAAAMFVADPERQRDMAMRADDESLAAALRSSYFHGAEKLFAELPRGRVNEFLAYAYMARGFYVPDAKKAIPSAFRSRRVYEAGVGRSFKLAEVPAKWRDVEMEAIAVARDAREIKSARDPLALLNDRSRGFADKGKHWHAELERSGFVKHDGRFVAFDDLPSHTLSDGWTLLVAKRHKGERFLFLAKPGIPTLRFAVRRGKVVVADRFTIGDDKTYGPALRETARQFLKGVDISNLNLYGVYQAPDGVRGEDETPRETIEGIEWSKTDHKGGKKTTAWIGNKPVFTMIVQGWKIVSSDTLDAPLALRHAREMISGLAKLSSSGRDRLRWQVRQFGVDVSRGKFRLLADRKIGSVKGYTVFWSPSEREITVYGEKGLITSAKVLKSGKIGARGAEVRGWQLNARDSKTDARKAAVANLLRAAVERLSAVAHGLRP